MFDIAYLRPLPNITLMAPRDEAMLVHMLHTALQIDGPAAIRYPRGAGVGVELPAAPELIRVGTGEILREGERVALVGYGTGVGKALGAADLLAERGLDVTVADARFVKPLDALLLASLAADHDLLVTVEEGVLAGRLRHRRLGVASSEEGAVAPRILRVGLPDRYVTHGAPALLHEEVGFTAEPSPSASKPPCSTASASSPPRRSPRVRSGGRGRQAALNGSTEEGQDPPRGWSIGRGV